MKRKILMAAVFVLALAVAVFVAEAPAPVLAAPDQGMMFESPLAPPNDDFVDATVIPGLPFSTYVDTGSATTETGEPNPSCAYGPIGKTVWYRFTPTQTGSVTVNVSTSEMPWNPITAVYTGSGLTSLSEVDCGMSYHSSSAFKAYASTPYYIQVGGINGSSDLLGVQVRVAPEPTAWISYFYPWEPSVYDDIYFYGSGDPGAGRIESYTWDLGDGTIATGQSVQHRYAADGDYPVKFTVITNDGRTASASQQISVRTRDVAITKFSTPQTAKAGQTRQLSIGVVNKQETVEVSVNVYKSTPYGFEFVGTSHQSVHARSGNRTTEFTLNYTFTNGDASIGKVTFKAHASILNGRDALPADNEAISSPTRVNP
jgi:hypothetical protein